MIMHRHRSASPLSSFPQRHFYFNSLILWMCVLLHTSWVRLGSGIKYIFTVCVGGSCAVFVCLPCVYTYLYFFNNGSDILYIYLRVFFISECVLIASRVALSSWWCNSPYTYMQSCAWEETTSQNRCSTVWVIAKPCYFLFAFFIITASCWESGWNLSHGG